MLIQCWIWIPLIMVSACGGRERGRCVGREAGL